ncbi:Odr-4p [Parelaphostrongylus tenuis]|uniref:Odr-4p n=1 Tax=Parelaphostrongylus tenuis TaxID=148309 RepID=A0AAD5MLD8_PARTN|nr:Odr-4p [Parelaphostrongylus tenuis]
MDHGHHIEKADIQKHQRPTISSGRTRTQMGKKKEKWEAGSGQEKEPLKDEIAGQMIVFDSSLEYEVNSTQKSQPENEREHGIPYVAYFLVGSFCSDGDIHVAHMAPCSLPSTATDSAGDSLSKTLDEDWIADNAEKVTRILPGGVNVVGLAFFSGRKIFNDQKAMLRRALSRTQQIANLLTTLGISSLSDSMALVFTESPIGKPMGLIVDVMNRAPDSPTKVSFSSLEWVSLVSSASARICLNVPTKTKQSHFFTEFVAAIRPFTENLFNCSLALINGEMRDESEQLFKDVKKKR